MCHVYRAIANRIGANRSILAVPVAGFRSTVVFLLYRPISHYGAVTFVRENIIHAPRPPLPRTCSVYRSERMWKKRNKNPLWGKRLLFLIIYYYSRYITSRLYCIVVQGCRIRRSWRIARQDKSTTLPFRITVSKLPSVNTIFFLFYV